MRKKHKNEISECKYFVFVQVHFRLNRDLWAAEVAIHRPPKNLQHRRIQTQENQYDANEGASTDVYRL